jgi:hypothetical protein
MKCFALQDTTLKQFYENHKDNKDSLIISSRLVLVNLQIGYYYGIVDSQGQKQVYKCIELNPPVFTSDAGVPGRFMIHDVLWEKSPEEMFKPDCCNG